MALSCGLVDKPWSSFNFCFLPLSFALVSLGALLHLCPAYNDVSRLWKRRSWTWPVSNYDTLVYSVEPPSNETAFDGAVRSAPFLPLCSCQTVFVALLSPLFIFAFLCPGTIDVSLVASCPTTSRVSHPVHVLRLLPSLSTRLFPVLASPSLPRTAHALVMSIRCVRAAPSNVYVFVTRIFLEGPSDEKTRLLT